MIVQMGSWRITQELFETESLQPMNHDEVTVLFGIGLSAVVDQSCWTLYVFSQPLGPPYWGAANIERSLILKRRQNTHSYAPTYFRS